MRMSRTVSHHASGADQILGRSQLLRQIGRPLQILHRVNSLTGSAHRVCCQGSDSPHGRETIEPNFHLGLHTCRNGKLLNTRDPEVSSTPMEVVQFRRLH
jgi:hypothetical protein